MNFKSRSRIFFAALVLLCSCSPALYRPIEADALRTGSSFDNLLTGRTLYIKHCGSCHNLHLPEQYTRTQWAVKLPEMKLKAKISDEETRLISDFIFARSKAE